MECNCNNNNSNGGVIPWVRGNRLPLIICVYENVVTQEQVGDSTLTVNEMTRVPYEIQDNDTVTVIMKSGFRQVAMPFTTDGNKVMVTDNGELPKGSYTVEVTIERGDGARGRWQETRQVRIYENTSDAQLGEMYSIDADLFFYAKGDTGTGIADITNNPDGTLTITMTDGTSYTTEALKGDKGDKGDAGERGVSIVSFDVTGQTDVSVIYTVTFSDDTTQDISVPKGPQGDTGLTGNGISTTTLNSDYTLTIAYTDGTTYTTPSIRGAQGAQGVSVIGFTQTGETATNTMYNLVFSDGRTQSVAIPKGTKGDKGDTGNTGPQGAQGPKGDTVTATDYTLYNVQGSDSQGAMSQDATTKAISAQTGYYTCGTVAGTAAKVATVENGNLYKRTLGGHFKVQMTNKNTAASGVTLQIGSETAAALWYNGAAVSASNTWDAGEVISVYYDGTYYQASNAQGGSNKKIDAYLYGDLRTLAVGQTYEDNESVQTTDKQLLKMPRPVIEMNLTDEIVAGDLRVYNDGTYKASKNVRTYTGNDSSYNEGDYAIGSYAEYTLTVTAGNSTGNIIVNTESIEITEGETAAEIAASIVENVVIDGWILSSEDDTVTVKCKTIGANTTSITFDDGDTGVTLSGISTPSSTGTDVLRVYASNSWNNAVLSDYAASSVWGEGALTLAQLQEEAVQNHVPKLYDDYGQNKDGAIAQKALDDIADERDEVVMRALLDLDERSGGGGSAGNALNYTKKNFYLFGASIEALACVSDPGKTAESLIPTAPGGWATYFKQAPYVKELYDYAAKAGAYSTCTGSATFTLNYNTGDSSKNIYWNQINLAIYNYLKGTVPAPDVVIMTTSGNDIQWQNNRDPQVIFSETADDVLCTNLNSFTFTKYSDADILSENISSNEVRTKCLTFASSWRYYVEMIYSYWPSTQIIFLGNLYTRGGDIPRSEVENVFNRENDLAESCCRKMGIPIIRGDYEGGRWNIYEMVKHIAAGGSPDDGYGTGKLHTWGWTYDGYHLTNEGAKMYGEYMISKVGSLLRYRYNV